MVMLHHVELKFWLILLIVHALAFQYLLALRQVGRVRLPRTASYIAILIGVMISQIELQIWHLHFVIIFVHVSWLLRHVVHLVVRSLDGLPRPLSRIFLRDMLRVLIRGIHFLFLRIWSLLLNQFCIYYQSNML